MPGLVHCLPKGKHKRMLKPYLSEKKTIVDHHLERYFSSPGRFPRQIHEAMRYSLLAGGKRFRPVLGIMVVELYRGKVQPFLPYMAALEMIHTYSLIHDDLPAMDDDNLRRGQPTLHKQYDEAIAILAGDALLTYAFYLLTAPNTEVMPERQLRMAHILADAAGVEGMVGGQVEDLLSTGETVDMEHLQTIHRYKTGRLISAPIEMASVYLDLPKKEDQFLREYAADLGLAFQIADDVLDVVGTEAMGKGLGKDAEQQKSTYVTLLSLEEAREKASQAVADAERQLAGLTCDTELLRQLARYVIDRIN